MGGGLPTKYGLSIRMLAVTYSGNRLTRISEVAVITNGVAPTDPWTVHPVANDIRVNGLKIGMRFEPKNAHQSTVEFTAGRTVPVRGPLPTGFTVLTEEPGVTTALGNVFHPGSGDWVGFRINGAQIPPFTYPDVEDRLFFRVTTPFRGHHRMDFELFPVVAVLASFAGFDTHYALGVGVLTAGHSANAMEFDSQVTGGF